MGRTILSTPFDPGSPLGADRCTDTKSWHNTHANAPSMTYSRNTAVDQFIAHFKLEYLRLICKNVCVSSHLTVHSPRRHPAHPISLPVLHPSQEREMQALRSQNHDRETLQGNADGGE